MANTADYGFRPYNAEAGKITHVRIDSTTAFVRGDPLVQDSSSPKRLALATASSSFIDAVAACNSTGLTDGDLAPVHLCTPGAQFVGRTDGATTIGILEQCDIIGASGAVMLNPDATSTNVARFIKIGMDGDAAGSAGASMVVSFTQRTGG